MAAIATTTIELDICTPEGKTWPARVIGVGGRYGIEREFVSAADRTTSRSGKTGTATYLANDGVYESNEGRRKLGRSFWIVANGTARRVDRDEALVAMEQWDDLASTAKTLQDEG